MGFVATRVSIVVAATSEHFVVSRRLGRVMDEEWDVVSDFKVRGVLTVKGGEEGWTAISFIDFDAWGCVIIGVSTCGGAGMNKDIRVGVFSDGSGEPNTSPATNLLNAGLQYEGGHFSEHVSNIER